MQDETNELAIDWTKVWRERP